MIWTLQKACFTYITTQLEHSLGDDTNGGILTVFFN